MRRLVLGALLGACLFAAQPARAQIAEHGARARQAFEVFRDFESC